MGGAPNCGVQRCHKALEYRAARGTQDTELPEGLGIQSNQKDWTERVARGSRNTELQEGLGNRVANRTRGTELVWEYSEALFYHTVRGCKDTELPGGIGVQRCQRE